MPVQIGAPREASFRQPFGLLSDCHRRVEMFLRVLTQLAARDVRTLAPDEADSLERALDYFRDAAPKHTADEEESLFPRLRTATGPVAEHALTIIRELEADHQDAGPRHLAVDALGRKWLATRTLSEEDAQGFRDHVSALARMYEHHIRIEDTVLFPAAETVLTNAETEAIGREMAARRISAAPRRAE